MFVYGNHAPDHGDALPPSVWHQWCSFFNAALSESESAVHTKAKNPSSLQVSHGVDTQSSREQGNSYTMYV